MKKHRAVIQYLPLIIKRDGSSKCHYCGCETWTDPAHVSEPIVYHARGLSPVLKWLIPASLENKRVQVDHVIPKSRGGTDELENLVIACAQCNQSKGHKTGDEFSAWLRGRKAERNE